MRADVIDHVISHVTSNVVVEVAQHVNDIVSQGLNDKFITELCASEECQKKQRTMENWAHDNSLLLAMMKNVSPDHEDTQGDETVPTRFGEIDIYDFVYI